MSQKELDLLVHRLDGGRIAAPNRHHRTRAAASHRVVGEWCRFTFYEPSSHFQEEILSNGTPALTDVDDLDTATGQMPRAFWADGGITLFPDYTPSQRDASMCAFLRLATDRNPLIFNPMLGSHLDWHQSDDDRALEPLQRICNQATRRAINMGHPGFS